MAILVGLALDQRGRAALDLGVLLARSGGTRLVVGVVLAIRWPADPLVGDVEYRELMRRAGQTALDQARRQVPPDVEATYLLTEARSVPSGLLHLAAEVHADMVVLGSSSAGLFGRVALGSATSRLLHSAHTPIAVATRGYRCGPRARVTRITVAFGGAASTQLLVASAAIAVRVGADLRVVRFAVSPATVFAAASPLPGDHSMEELVQDAWLEAGEDSLRSGLQAVQELPEPPAGVVTAVGRGYSWDEAFDCVHWQPGEVLVIGSSDALGARVFLGSTGSRILRHSPVPVVVVPHVVIDELMDAVRG